MTTASDVALYAINTGKWYAKHVHIAFHAEGKAPLIAWAVHVSFHVLPEYELVTGDDTRGVTVQSICEALDAYYSAHVREMVAIRDAEIAEQAEWRERGK